MASVGTVVIEVDANIAKLVEGMKKSHAQISNLQRTADSATKTLANFAKAATTLFVGSQFLSVAKDVISLTDTYKQMSGQLHLVTSTTEEFSTAQKSLFDISQKTRQGFEQTSKLFVSFSSSMKQMGKSQKEILGVTETVNQAIALSGSTAQEAASSILQLGQAFGSGKLAGDELKSILENSRGLAMAIADGMNVPIGKLKEMGAAGTITSEVLFNALTKMAESIDTRFATLPVTVGQSVIRIKNSLLDLAGGAEATFGVGGSLSVAFSSLSSSITSNKDAIISFLNVVKEMITQAAILAAVWKLQALVIAPVINSFKGMEVGATSLMGKYIALRFGLAALATSLKAFAMANLPFIALTAAFEAWNYVTNKSADAQDKLKTALALTVEEAKKLTQEQQMNSLNVLTQQLSAQKDIATEVAKTYGYYIKIGRAASVEGIEARANLDTENQKTSSLIAQIDAINSVINSTSAATSQSEALAASGAKVVEVTIKAAEAAYKLSSALGNAVLGMNIQLIKAQEMAGKITETSAVKQVASLNIDNVKSQMAEINQMYGAVGANREELNIQMINLYTEEMKLQQGLATDLKSIDTKKASEAEAAARKVESANKAASRSAISAGKSAAKAGEDAAKSLEDAAQAADSLNRKFLELTGQKDKIFGLDVDKQLKEFMDSGLYTAEQIGQAYDGMYKDYVDGGKDASKEIALDFTDQFKGLFEGIFSGDLGGAIKGFLDGISMDLMKNMVSSLSTSMTGWLSSLLGGLGDFGKGIIGLGLGMLTSMLSTTVSQQEIDAAKGEVEFSDDSLKNLQSTFESAQYPMLEVTNKMHNHIRNMDANFFSIARAFSAQASAGGTDLTGANFVDTQSSTFLGFSSKSISLLGTGLNFALQDLATMMDESALSVQSYTTTLTEKSSFFGLRNSSKINEVMSMLPSGATKDMADAFASGYETIMTAGVSLGLNEADLAMALQNTKVAIGKIDFTGLSDEEVANRLSQAYSTYFSGVITGVDDFSVLISRYGQNTEEALATLGRIAVEYDQGQHSFGLIGKTFKEGTASVLREWETSTQVFVRSGAFGRGVETVTNYFSEVVTGAYTAQMQILDIIESAGGLTSFQDAMGAFMSGFYTESEQLDFMTKSMAESFKTLGIAMPKTDAEFRTLLETMDTSTEAGAYAYGQVLLLADGFNQMTDAMDASAEAIKAVTDASNENIKTYLDSFKDNQQLAQDMANDLGVSLATTDTALTSLFENLKGGVDGLNNSELELLMANKGLIEEAAKAATLASEEAAKAMTDMIKSISDAWLGNLSYLTMKQKSDYASGYLAIASSSNGAIDTVEAARLAAETALKTTTTKEEYIPIFEKYINELEKKAPDATNTDIVARLDEVVRAVKEMDDNIIRTRVAV